MKFKVKNCNIFPMPNSNNELLHIATIEYGFREFVIMLRPVTSKIYIEEVVLNTVDYSNDIFANCKYISDDELFKDLVSFAQMNNLMDIKKIVEKIIEKGNIKWLISQ